MTPFPARIHCLLALDAPIGLVIRRGPSKRVATILWDRRRDEFKVGQWLKGRIYERRCDISPDGKHLIYFAMAGGLGPESPGSWTAVSRVPYLKAIVFMPKGDSWNGGGMWARDRDYWLNDGPGGKSGHTISKESPEVQRVGADPFGTGFGECLQVYFPRLIRDGWIHAAEVNSGRPKCAAVFEKDIGKGWTLRKIVNASINHPVGKGCYWDEHELVGPEAGQVTCHPTWEWADLDGKRLVWAADGKLWAAEVRPSGLANEVLLHDFNAMEYRRIAAPY
jgi:hypothetical protein